MTRSLLCVLALAAASCSNSSPSKGPAEGEKAAAGQGQEIGGLMIQVARRFEVAGKAAVAHRFELAAFEIDELGEMFADDVPVAKLPKEGPSAHIPAMAQAFLKSNIPELKKAAATSDAKAFADAFQHASAACNACHTASAKGFVIVPSVPGKGVPDLDRVGSSADQGAQAAASGAPATMTVKAVALPGATGPASLDYIAYEPAAHGPARVWVPVGVTGSVDVFDIASGTMKRVDGFKTAEREWHGQKRIAGPSSVTLTDAFAYVGDRATNEVCGVDRKTLARVGCFTVPTGIDGIAAVASTHEIWVTTPSEHTITILDASAATGALKLAGKVTFAGDPEGYAVDEPHGLFYTNLEDKASTVVVDVKKRAVKATWKNGCGETGPRGVAVDGGRGLVMVACTDHVEVLDAAHDGALLGKMDTGEGVDNLDYVASTQRLYAAAGKAMRLSVFSVGSKGELALVAQAETREGARNAVADEGGNAYIADSKAASLLVATAPAK